MRSVIKDDCIFHVWKCNECATKVEVTPDFYEETGLTGFVCAEIYTYANDEHIFAALRKICPVVKKRY